MAITVNGPQGGAVPETTPARDSTAAERGTARADNTERTAEDARSKADRAEVTESGRRISDAVRALENVPAVDEARVEALREQIESGRFEVDAERVADRLISFENDLER